MLNVGPESSENTFSLSKALEELLFYNRQQIIHTEVLENEYIVADECYNSSTVSLERSELEVAHLRQQLTESIQKCDTLKGMLCKVANFERHGMVVNDFDVENTSNISLQKANNHIQKLSEELIVSQSAAQRKVVSLQAELQRVLAANESLCKEIKSLSKQLAQRVVLFNALQRKKTEENSFYHHNRDELQKDLSATSARLSLAEESLQQVHRENSIHIVKIRELSKELEVSQADLRDARQRMAQSENELTTLWQANADMHNTLQQLRRFGQNEVQEQQIADLQAERNNLRLEVEQLRSRLLETNNSNHSILAALPPSDELLEIADDGGGEEDLDEEGAEADESMSFLGISSSKASIVESAGCEQCERSRQESVGLHLLLSQNRARVSDLEVELFHLKRKHREVLAHLISLQQREELRLQSSAPGPEEWAALESEIEHLRIQMVRLVKSNDDLTLKISDDAAELEEARRIVSSLKDKCRKKVSHYRVKLAHLLSHQREQERSVEQVVERFCAGQDRALDSLRLRLEELAESTT